MVRKLVIVIILVITIGALSMVIQYNRNGYELFVKTCLNLSTSNYQNSFLDEEDKKILPEILEQYKFDYKIIAQEIYVEKNLSTDMDMMRKITNILRQKRGKPRFGYFDGVECNNLNLNQ